MNIKPIRNDKDLRKAFQRLEADPPGSARKKRHRHGMSRGCSITAVRANACHKRMV